MGSTINEQLVYSIYWDWFTPALAALSVQQYFLWWWQREACWCCSSNFILFLHFKAITVFPVSAVYSSYIDWCAFPNTEMVLCWLKQVSPVSMSPTPFSSSCWWLLFRPKMKKSCLDSLEFGFFSCDIHVQQHQHVNEVKWRIYNVQGLASCEYNYC